MRESVCVYVYVCHLEGIGSLGARGRGDCELSSVGAGN